jgi:hypothetical protein
MFLGSLKEELRVDESVIRRLQTTASAAKDPTTPL